ncbi:GtrA family protein [Holzapfeliella floricola]|uniref:GtrA/DPMS transmembrane domain-containing protein n=1 Tax=Holzapfeliella floricola DSM 23037 = JCM 16512 TaxID=1423744 RepID=A0A0R2DWP7_9LACO|nr:GtrA family protein [Holzapfeliella floricola]KRN04733.1 hypothetical protein FC86_GL001089 [Holzapfeliella floricola DSM 23037 = JCM 16512]
MSPVTQHTKINRDFIIYCLIGISGLVVDFGSFFILHTIFESTQILNFVSSTLGLTSNFFLNAHYNFKVKDNLLKRYLNYYVVGLVGIMFSNLILFIFATKLGYNIYIVKLFALGIVTVSQYTFNKFVTFKEAADDKVTDN